MRLPRPFFRLPLRFDAERLRLEAAAAPHSAWARHPNDIRGNSSLRLISVDGEENDDVDGVMSMTPHLRAAPYIRQILAGLGVVWSRSRLLRLAPGAVVPEHADINYHWFNRVRLHIPIVTRPEVRFWCGDDSVHMAAGEAWIFDNWRLHRVENCTSEERIHLVADTSGSAAFWRLAMQGDSSRVQEIGWSPEREGQPLTERTRLAIVMPPAEVDLLVHDLHSELVPQDASEDGRSRLIRYHGVLDALRSDWRQLYALYGAEPDGWGEFTKLRDSLRAMSQSLSVGLVMRTNRISAHTVLEARLLRPMLALPPDASRTARSASTPGVERRARRPRLKAPVFIIAAPRSGSTLLFETLAASSQVCTLGGEAHWLVENQPELRPDAGSVDSNRLTAQHATPQTAEHVISTILGQLKDCRNQPLADPGALTFLEKTPKNALRIPFFDRIFPDARFILLWRDPRENLSSMMEAWRSGQWKTYPQLDGFNGSWSLLLPPGFSAMNGRPLEEIVAWQWREMNRIALGDLGALPRERWTALHYADLVRDPAESVARLCGFLRLTIDDALATRLRSPAPPSRYTQTPPAPEKWRKNEAAIERVLPSVEPVWRRLREAHEEGYRLQATGYSQRCSVTGDNDV